MGRIRIIIIRVVFNNNSSQFLPKLIEVLCNKIPIFLLTQIIINSNNQTFYHHNDNLQVSNSSHLIINNNNLKID